MNDWIIKDAPPNNHNVLVSLKWDEEAHIGFYTTFLVGSKVLGMWHIWINDEREKYDATDVDGWMPIPKSVYALAQEKSE